ncbi:radical SAM family heme chaperone HemW [Calorimonas adulescens]|jgi:putative oxygen-independent coproporphyrinogen III oxidase|nr:radical SAM family heme chaperone HemW [Calorimonas adulescens]
MGPGLYVHIPFCKRKCLYCDFNSYQSKEYLIDDYIDAVLKEADLYPNENGNIETVFIGGGTPTVLSSKQLLKLIGGLRDKFGIRDNVEFTVEANPGTVDRDKLSLLRDLGVNRLSFGVQSMDDRLLKILGRIHDVCDFMENFNEAKKLGFDNINVDLMFGIPGQALYGWIKTLEEVVSLQPEHISCYGLMIEEGTPYYKMYKDNRLSLPDEDTEREMYWKAVQMLESNGYLHYEISNFAKKGYECRHNIIYWCDKPYIGLGAGAHTYYKDYRFANELIPEKYIEFIRNNDNAFTQREYIDKRNEMAEFMFMGLRLINGIKLKEFEDRFGVSLYNAYDNRIAKLLKFGLIELQDDRVYLTKKGIDLSNQVFMEFMN